MNTENVSFVPAEGAELLFELSDVEEFESAVTRGAEQPVRPVRVPVQVHHRTLVRETIVNHYLFYGLKF